MKRNQLKIVSKSTSLMKKAKITFLLRLLLHVASWQKNLVFSNEKKQIENCVEDNKLTEKRKIKLTSLQLLPPLRTSGKENEFSFGENEQTKGIFFCNLKSFSCWTSLTYWGNDKKGENNTGFMQSLFFSPQSLWNFLE